MVATVNPLVTVLTAVSPLVVPKRNGDDDGDASVSSGTILNPAKSNLGATSIALSFSPAGDLALLSRPVASVLLTEQAGEPPAILQNHTATTKSTTGTGSAFAHKDSSFSAAKFGAVTESFLKTSQLQGSAGSTSSGSSGSVNFTV